MKKFNYFGTEYTVMDMYDYIATDKSGEVWVYVGKPTIPNPLAMVPIWDCPGSRANEQVGKISIHVCWTESLRKIDDLVNNQSSNA